MKREWLYPAVPIIIAVVAGCAPTNNPLEPLPVLPPILHPTEESLPFAVPTINLNQIDQELSREQVENFKDYFNYCAQRFSRLAEVSQTRITINLVEPELVNKSGFMRYNFSTSEVAAADISLSSEPDKKKACHELWHLWARLLSGKYHIPLAGSPFYNDDRFKEGLTEMVAHWTEGEPKSNEGIQALGDNAFNQLSSIKSFAILAFEDDKSLFSQHIANLLYRIGSENFQRFIKQDFPGQDTESVLRKVIGSLLKSADKPNQALWQLVQNRYKSVADFEAQYPYFKEEKPGPRLLTVYSKEGLDRILEVYYITVDENGVIKKLSGSVTIKANGRVYDQNVQIVDGELKIYLPPTIKGSLDIALDKGGSATKDHIEIK